jgi:hypothetical protein
MRNPVRSILCSLALLLPIAAHAQQTPIALTGTLVMPDTVIDQGTVLLQDGRILSS